MRRITITPSGIDLMMQELRKKNALAKCEQRYVKINHTNKC